MNTLREFKAVIDDMKHSVESNLKAEARDGVLTADTGLERFAILGALADLSESLDVIIIEFEKDADSAKVRQVKREVDALIKLIFPNRNS